MPRTTDATYHPRYATRHRLRDGGRQRPEQTGRARVFGWQSAVAAALLTAAAWAWTAARADDPPGSLSTPLQQPQSTPAGVSRAPHPLEEEIPPFGKGNMLSESQIRYCLAEFIRIEAVRPVMNRYRRDQVEFFNALIAAYNSRCAKYRYELPAMDRAKYDVETNRSRIEGEARQAFLTRFQGPEKGRDQQVAQAAGPETPPSPQAQGEPSEQPVRAAAAKQTPPAPAPTRAAGPTAAATTQTPPAPVPTPASEEPVAAPVTPPPVAVAEPAPEIPAQRPQPHAAQPTAPAAEPSTLSSTGAPAQKTVPGSGTPARELAAAAPPPTATEPPPSPPGQPVSATPPVQPEPSLSVSPQPQAAPPQPPPSMPERPAAAAPSKPAAEIPAPAEPTVARAAPARETTQPAATRDVALARFERDIQRAGKRVIDKTRYPELAKMGKKWTGKAQIEVQFAAGGYISRIVLAESCGHPPLDEKALELARTIMFPHVPEELTSRDFTVRFPIEFRSGKG
jgi:TonB family protein